MHNLLAKPHKPKRHPGQLDAPGFIPTPMTETLPQDLPKMPLGTLANPRKRPCLLGQRRIVVRDRSRVRPRCRAVGRCFA